MQPHIGWFASVGNVLLRIEDKNMQQIKCTECSNISVVLFKWPTSQGQCEASFCRLCAENWQKKWGHTPSGQGLIIEPGRRYHV